jgi:hypothetical protein
MLIYALIYWSIILLAGIIFTFKIFEDILNIVIKICRKWIITRLLIVVPLRLTINILTSTGIGIIVFFHVLFFVCIAVFIYVFTIGPGDSKFFTDSMAYICLFSLFAPIVYSIIKTIFDEIQEYRNSKDN